MTGITAVCFEHDFCHHFLLYKNEKKKTLMHHCTVTSLSVDYAYIKKFLSVFDC